MSARVAAVFLCTCAAAAADEPADALAKLRQGGEVSCQPALPYFCENVHVRCIGRTSVSTFAFKLRAARGTGPVELDAAPEEFQHRYANASVAWGEDGSYVLLGPRGTNGYLKLLADGKYVFRHYLEGRGVMSLGSCR